MSDAAPSAKPLQADDCPLCGQPNACAVSASGSFDVDCWCRRVTFDESVLKRIPPELKGRACLCLQCAQLGSGRHQTDS